MPDLYPPIEPYRTHELAVDDLHTLYVEEVGNPMGLPVVVLHGGPGVGCDPSHRRFFDAAIYRVILFDQRGAGRSRPHAELRDNTTWHLIADMEAIRAHLGIERWLLFGGSWGATLGLLYAQAHAQRVLGLILRGLFLARQMDVDWFYKQGASRVLADHWRDFLAPLAEESRHDPVSAYYQILTGEHLGERLRAAQAWCVWEGHAIGMMPSPHVVKQFSQDKLALSMARTECHYFINACFLDQNQILRDADRLSGIPAIIIHGRYDIVCPLENAVSLHARWPDAELHIIEGAGHAASEPGIRDALLSATREMAARLGAMR